MAVDAPDAVVSVTPLRTVEELRAIRPEWDTLASGACSPFVTWEWMVCWWEAYGAGRSLEVLCVRRGRALIGLAPFYLDRCARFGFVAYRVGRFLGDGSHDSDYLDLLSMPGAASTVVRAVVDHLQDRRSEWDAWLFNEIPAASPHLDLLRTLCRSLGEVDESERPCGVLSLPGDWERYLKTLRPRMRTKIRSLRRNLEERFKVDVQLASTDGQVGAALDSLFTLHQWRWESEDRRGVFRGAEKRRFYRDMARAFFDRGWLRLYSLAVNGRWVAHEFCFEHAGRLYLLQEGYDPAWSAAGVGNVLRAYIVRDCIERGVAEYDFLGGVTEHKLSWGAVAKSTVGLSITRRTLPGRWYRWAPRAAEWSRRIVAATWLPAVAIRTLRGLRRRIRGGRAAEGTP